MNKQLLQIKNIKKEYRIKDTLIQALKGVSLDIFQGEVIGLLGVNGAGKTTLSSIIASLYPPTSGDIVIDGKSAFDDLAHYRQMIGFCPQKVNLHPALTMKENLVFSGRYYGLSDQESIDRAEEIMHKHSLTKYADATVNQLSGGYKQRFLIARALVHNPRLVLLDEPTVGLDPHIRQQLWDVVRGLKQDGVTVILTTHYLDEAEVLSDRICLMDSGQISLIDTPANLMKTYEKENLESVFMHLMQDAIQEDKE